MQCWNICYTKSGKHFIEILFTFRLTIFKVLVNFSFFKNIFIILFVSRSTQLDADDDNVQNTIYEEIASVNSSENRQMDDKSNTSSGMTINGRNHVSWMWSEDKRAGYFVCIGWFQAIGRSRTIPITDPTLSACTIIFGRSLYKRGSFEQNRW